MLEIDSAIPTGLLDGRVLLIRARIASWAM